MPSALVLASYFKVLPRSHLATDRPREKKFVKRGAALNPTDALAPRLDMRAAVIVRDNARDHGVANVAWAVQDHLRV
jgi:hypothetical protein